MKSHKETINKHKIELLKQGISHVDRTGNNEIPLSIFSGNINSYNNFQKLRYHALIFKVKRGTWGITKQGGQFLRGELDLAKWVIIQDNHIIERSPSRVNIRHAYQGSTIVHTTFEYFRDNEPIGIRPLEIRVNQMSLV